MKKIISVLAILAVACITIFSFTACNNNTITVNPCWANNEILTYTVYDNNVQNGAASVGSLRFTLKSDLLTDAEKQLSFNGNEKTYSSANVRLEETLIYVGKAEIHTTVLAKDYTVLATNKTYTDLVDATKSYTVQSYHDGKEYVYALTYSGTATQEGTIKVGSSDYTDNEFLYYYIRCYSLSGVPSAINVADPLSGLNYKLTCGAKENAATIKTECDLGSVACNLVQVAYSEEPVGSPINIYYLPDSIVFESVGIKQSTKVAARIEENNIVYVLNGYEVYYNK